jgi:hypothetical protein
MSLAQQPGFSKRCIVQAEMGRKRRASNEGQAFTYEVTNSTWRSGNERAGPLRMCRELW